ncbi:MAG TPA: folylpolyglutamate synthase/dihydrofolate synthase family protein [Ktedonobacteraceae bacterium]|nr:folylpolyglutamate synthase/dihydrofolate synthase family protein [Ktedonobacteraceae bacterium]
MNYSESLAYLYSLSDFERGSAFTRSPEENLPREEQLLEALGNPHLCYSNTLIAGTKGKGSTAAFIERVLREAGLRTGLYTQPDLHTFRERIRVNGQLIREEEVAELLSEIQDAVDVVQETGKFGPFITYEVATALALLYFCRQHVQHAVIEVGLGGRLDATNVTHPLVSVITSISYDHMQILGNTLTEIATEKAGIIKPNGVVVTSAQAPEALLAIAAACQRQHARFVRIGSAENDPAQAEVEAGLLPSPTYRYRLERRKEEQQQYTVWTPTRTYAELTIPLAGQHQLENATCALATLDLLREQGIVWDESALRSGFYVVHWPARMEVIGHDPMIVVDGAHNADSMQTLLQALRSSFALHRLIIVLSVNSDKDLAGIVKALADADIVVLTQMMNPRAATIAQLEQLFAEYASQVQRYTAANTSDAMDMALDLAENNDLICVTGSLYTAAEALRWSAARGNATVAEEIKGVDH